MIADYEPKERMPLVLKGYSIKDHHYDHYDNYDAINVDRAVDIPIDYDGVIGVPITILSYLWEDGLIHCAYTKKATPKSDFYLDNVKKNPIFLSGNQFEIVWRGGDIEWAETECTFYTPPTKDIADNFKKQDKTWRIQNPYLLDKDGYAHIVYQRIFIKKVS